MSSTQPPPTFSFISDEHGDVHAADSRAIAADLTDAQSLDPLNEPVPEIKLVRRCEPVAGELDVEQEVHKIVGHEPSAG